jgi:formylglycine-generating enzyme required for sulfatase activity
MATVLPFSDAAEERAMVRLDAGTFRMGSDRHYPEEAPRHVVEVNAFRIDRAPVTNAEFAAFFKQTGHITTAEIAPDPKDYPGLAGDVQSWITAVHADRRSSRLDRLVAMVAVRVRNSLALSAGLGQ